MFPFIPRASTEAHFQAGLCSRISLKTYLATGLVTGVLTRESPAMAYVATFGAALLKNFIGLAGENPSTALLAASGLIAAEADF